MITISRAEEVFDLKKNPANLFLICSNYEKRNLIMNVDFLSSDQKHLFINQINVIKYTDETNWTIQNPCDDKIQLDKNHELESSLTAP